MVIGEAVPSQNVWLPSPNTCCARTASTTSTSHTVAMGLAVGIHTTLASGFTIGLMAPVIGYSSTPNYNGTTNTGVSYYFISSAVSMALGYMGYRF